MKFKYMKEWRIPEGNVIDVACRGVNIWHKVSFAYVSLGDSIAAGHTINDRWDQDYGYDSQYGANGNISTAIVTDSYTDLLGKRLNNQYGKQFVFLKSFAKSGETVSDLIRKLDDSAVRSAIEIADLVTICIGANDVLEPAMSNLEEYINTGDLSTIAAMVNANIARLSNDNDANSYVALFDKLAAINPTAKYVFTTVYNPYKYLWIEKGHHGFFGPLLDSIPTINLFGFNISSLIKDGLLNTPIVKQLFDRVNGLDAWSENFVTRLNGVLADKLTAYQAKNPNFLLADVKTVFDAFPDRPISATKNYNDLVSVEYTRGYNTAQMDWGRLWGGPNGAANYWTSLASKYAGSSGLDINGFASELIADVAERVVIPDIDPHPEWYGHYVINQSILDSLDWSELPRYTITFKANGGSGSMPQQTVVGVDNLTAYPKLYANKFTTTKEGYRFVGWNTAPDGSGTSYSDEQVAGIRSDIVLHAQWSNIYNVVFRHSYDSSFHNSSDTGPQECYAFWIEGQEQGDLSKFSNPARVYHLPYGTALGVVAQTKSGDGRSYVTWNGNKVAGNSDDARWGFTLTSDLDINFEWTYWIEGVIPQSYWNCYITTK